MNATPADTAADGHIRQMRWRIDPQRSSVEFHVRHLWGLQTVKGRFERYAGTLDFDANPAIKLTIEADSLTTGNARRDEHLRSGDFFHTSNHPEVRFESRSVDLTDGRLDVVGELHAAGSNVPVQLLGSLTPRGDEFNVDVTGNADHRGLGITWNPLGMIRGDTTLIVKAHLVPDTQAN
jgi:polyisoprenoid-binding protein YceI